MEYEKNEFMHALGLRLRQARLARGDRQVDLGARIGVSRQTIMKMEAGGEGVPLDVWLSASAILGLLDTWAEVLIIPKDPFQEYDEQMVRVKRNPRRRKNGGARQV